MAENLIGMLNSGTADLPIATRSSLGAVKVGQGINVDSDGNINLQVSNPLTVQRQTSTDTLSVKRATGSTPSESGVVYQGDNITINDGRISGKSGQSGGSYTAGYGLKMKGNQFYVNNALVVCNTEWSPTYNNVRLWGWWQKRCTVRDDRWTVWIDNLASWDVKDRMFSWTVCCVNAPSGVYVTGIKQEGDNLGVYAMLSQQLGAGDTVECSILKWGFHTDHNSISIHGTNKTIEDIMHYKNLYVTEPTKRIYYIGETLNTAGMNAYFSLSYDEYEAISLADCTITGFESTTAGEKEVVISYEYQPEGETDPITFTYSVFVTVQKEAESIEISKLPDQTKYFVNDDESFNGLEIKANYSDETSEIIPTEDCTITRYSELTEWGVRIYQVDYQDVTTYFNIEIYEPAIEDIMVVPNGETPEDPLDVLVYEVYNDRTIQLVPDGYEVTEIPPNDINVHQSTRINVKYKNFEKDLLIPTNRG